MQPPFAAPIRETERGERDPAASQKDAAEREWESELLQFFAGQTFRIKEKLKPGIPQSRKAIEDLGNRLDDGFWDGEAAALLAVILALLKASATDSAAIQAGLAEIETSIGFDWTLANAEAISWARKHAGKLIEGITETTRQGIASTIASWIEQPGATMGDLFGELESGYAFSQSRARLIAVSEVTMAYDAGQEAVYRELANSGLFKVEAVWQTNKDSLVCDFCRPLDGQVTDKRPGVDSHPGCRCWRTFKIEVKE